MRAKSRLGFTHEDLAPCFSNQDQLSYEQFLQVIDGKTTGVLRASIGLVSTFDDVYAYVQFAYTFINRSSDEIMTHTTIEGSRSAAVH